MSYPGGKNRVYQHLINLIPYHTVYIAPFLGEDAIMQHKRPAILNIGTDLDADVIDRWQRGRIPHPTHSDPPSPRFTVLASDTSCSPGSTTTSDDTAPPPQLKVSAPLTRFGDTSAPPVPVMRPDRDPHHYRTRWSFINRDYKYALSNYPFTGSHFVYIDAPYLQDVRASQRPLYAHEFNTEEQHTELLSILLKLPCTVMVSHYPHPLYAETLSTWYTASYMTTTRSGRAVREYVWMNYPVPNHLHDYSYLGNDFRERERIKKKQDRWFENFGDMPDLERRALLQRLAEAGMLA